MIKAICFDLDGVYFTKIGMESFVESLVSMGCDRDKIMYAIFKSDEMKSFKRGEISEFDFWNYINTTLGLNKTVSEYKDLLVSGYEVNTEVQVYILELRSKGYKTCICTNNFETRISTLEARFGFLQNFDVKIISYEKGILKPDKEIFKSLIVESGLDASEIAYSDDNEDKLLGAKELGIEAFVYVDFDQFQQKLVELGIN